MSEIEVGDWDRLNWLWLVIGLIALAAITSGWNRRAKTRFATAEMIDRIFPKPNFRRQLISGLLVVTTLLLLVVCVVDIRWGKVRRDVPQRGIELMFVLDVSRSMLASDVTPSRLKRAKQMIKDTIDEMAGDRIGLVVFAGEPRQRIPLTSHYDDFKQALDEVGPHNVARGGSRLGDAIRLATEGFLTKTNEHKAILLLTDGEDQESNPVDAARKAEQEQGIRIFPVGLGDLVQGARIPLDAEDGSGYLQHEGQQVWSKLNGAVLTEVAEVTGGAYIPAGTKRVNMADVYHGYIANIEQKDFTTAEIDSYEARYQWFLAPALLLLLAEVVISTRGVKEGPKNLDETNAFSSAV